MHSYGNITPFIPELVNIGVDALNPIEIKAGMNVLVIKLKREFGDKIVLHGGINAVLWDKKDEIIAEIDRTIPVLKEKGGYIFLEYQHFSGQFAKLLQVDAVVTIEC